MDALERESIRAHFEPINLEAGMALFECQRFEYGISVLIFCLSKQGLVRFDPETAAAILYGEEKKSAGQVIGLLKGKVTMSNDLEERLASGLRARNHIVHKMVVESLAYMREPSGDFRAIENLRVLRSEVRDTLNLLSPIIEGLTATPGFEEQREYIAALSRISNAHA